ncbi:hypothetical protein MSAN_01326700 [Mycena sanguinolenta]|uniref:Uncharacterized protein n=1 Tax=Mycena sanguinolenta TaxID=230812 RepID=A0A8H7D2T6_9AGAR|nr:hypothetical protein MSAN_01326700 [Mycena sanguinolenta]
MLIKRFWVAPARHVLYRWLTLHCSSDSEGEIGRRCESYVLHTDGLSARHSQLHADALALSRCSPPNPAAALRSLLLDVHAHGAHARFLCSCLHLPSRHLRSSVLALTSNLFSFTLLVLMPGPIRSQAQSSTIQTRTGGAAHRERRELGALHAGNGGGGGGSCVTDA